MINEIYTYYVVKTNNPDKAGLYLAIHVSILTIFIGKFILFYFFKFSLKELGALMIMVHAVVLAFFNVLFYAIYSGRRSEYLLDDFEKRNMSKNAVSFRICFIWLVTLLFLIAIYSSF